MDSLLFINLSAAVFNRGNDVYVSDALPVYLSSRSDKMGTRSTVIELRREFSF